MINATMYYTTKNGQKILISEMGDRHLLNTIALIQRKAKEGIVVQYGGGSCPDDYWYDEDRLTGEDALKRMNYAAYLDEAQRRGIGEHK